MSTATSACTFVVDVDGKQPSFTRADLELEGVEQAGPSFELRVFLNNPAAGPETPRTAQQGYAGTVHVYGYGLQDEPSTPAPHLPMQRTLIATEAVRLAARRGPRISVTIVPVAPGGAVDESVARCPVERVSLVTRSD